METKNKYKKCYTCRSSLLPKHYHKNRASKDGLQISCKQCNKKASKRNYQLKKKGHKVYKETLEKIVLGQFDELFAKNLDN